jgi:hypothetical protein
MADDNLSKTGVFFDTKNQKVVDSQPEEGVQIVAPGGELTKAVEDDIARWRDVENGVVREPQTVTTQTVKRSAKTTEAKPE